MLACLVAGLLIPSIAPAQTGAADSKPAPAAASRDPAAARQQVEQDTTLTADIKAKVLELIEQAETAASQAEKLRSENDLLQKRIDSAPSRIVELRQQLDNPPAPEPLPSGASIETLQSLISQKRAEFLAARDAADRYQAEKAELVRAASTLLADYVERERSVQRLNEQLNAAPAPGEAPILQQARRGFLTARKALEESTLEAHRLRTFNHDLLVELITRELDVALARASALEAQVKELDQLLQREREDVARVDRLEATATLATTAELPEAIAKIAGKNAELKADIESAIERENTLNESLRSAAQLLRELNDSFSTIRERVSTYGASQAIGRLLQRRLNLLPSTLEYRQRARQRQGEISDVINRRIDIEDERRTLSDVDTGVDSLMASIPPEEVESKSQELRERAMELLRSKRDTLTDLHDAYNRYMTRLVALDTAEKEIAQTVAEMSSFIRKQLLWIPTLPPLSPKDLTATPTGLLWLISPVNWLDAIKEAFASFVATPFVSSLFLLAVIAVFVVRRQAKRELPALAERTRRIRTESFTLTLKALAYTLVAALSLPISLAFFSRLLAAEPTPDEAHFSLAVADAMWEIMIFAYVLGLLRWLTRSSGLGPRHFRWAPDVCRRLHVGLLWLPWVVLPLVFTTSVAMQSLRLEHIVGVGRPALITALVAIVVFLWRSFGRSGPFGKYLQDHEDDWQARLWFLWFPLILGIPLALCVMSGLGYQEAARTLGYLIFGETMCLLIGLRLLNDILIRWFNVTERQSRLAAALRQREEARAERGQEEPEGISGFEIEVPEVDYHELGEQARTVIRVGVFLGLILSIGTIWSDLVPTLGLLERVNLPFSKLALVDGVERQLPVNLADLIVGLLILAGTLFAAKNLSGLLEFTFLRRLRLDTGGNYAIVTLCKYSIIAIGVMATLSTIGLQWSKIQWLVAALGVGLGFGLQEIVANFVSGIILLLERPVRIGDVVTVGNADGFVSRIRIRATTILTWEKKELIIPNKEFITGQVLNWTLSDSLNRIMLNVGVAYGSDVSKALELLKEAAAENDNVLADPQPLATFEAFGNDALMLYLRCYIGSLDNRLLTVTALHQAVYEKFAQAGIVIAFPQRDVHLDTSRPLEIQLSRPSRGPDPA